MNEADKTLKDFIKKVDEVLAEAYQEDNIEAIKARLTQLGGLLPSATKATALALELLHKRKESVMVGMLNDENSKKWGTSIIKEIAKDRCAEELANLEEAKGLHEDIKEQIGALRTILSLHKEELASGLAHQV